jgi:hypothetical protein
MQTAQLHGLTENAGPENEGPKKNNGWKIQDMKMTTILVRHFQVLHFQCPQFHIAPGDQTGLGRYPRSIERISSSG